MMTILNIIGGVNPPPGVSAWGGTNAAGLIPFLSAILKLFVVIAGLYALLNIIFAGYGFISAGGDPKGVEKAWSKIWQSIVGLFIVAASFALAAILGWLIFKDPGAILQPKIYGPN